MAQSSPGQTSVSTSVRKSHPVKTLAGHPIELMHDREKKFYEQARDKYTSENVFSAASDLRGVDRLILFETQVYRWQWQLAAGKDYDDVPIEPSEEIALRRSIKETEQMISQLQNDLGLTKVQRDKAGSAESVAEYITNLKLRAKEHGVRRDKQVGRAIELINELIAICGSYTRANENERRKLGFESAEDIVEWVLEVAQPRYNEVDEAYRQNQKMWIRTL